MGFQAGDTLGPYEIIESIGKGGMGEVYRARDTRLGREVAIKVSAEKFGERFEREARVISSLNHPNICTLYDVGASPNAPGYLVMELIEGPTLAERIAEGAIPLEESLNVARQIASALEAAHEKGITHRDLKPGNVKVKPDGSVKVLDFGLAKVGPRVATGDLRDGDESPTLSMAGTQAGVILGTAGYMAPEQARGKPVDKRADIWAFGVVLYEMVTGKKLFAGEDLTETLAAVVMKEPDLSGAPAQVRRLLAKCLVKDPRKRLRDISGVELLLEEVQAAGAPQAGSLPHIGGKKWVWPAVAALLLVVAAFGWMRSGSAETREPTMALNIVPPADTPMTDVGIDLGTPILSPDGSAVLYAARGGLYVRRLDSLSATLVAGSERVVAPPFWAADSASVFYPTVSELIRVRLPDGAPNVVATLPGFTRSGSENADGALLISALERLYVLVAPGGEFQKLPVPRFEETPVRYPEFLPDGKNFLFSMLHGGVYLASLEDGKVVNPVLLLASDTQAAYTPAGGGRLLFVRNDNLYSQKLDLSERKLVGDSQLIQEGIASTPVNPVNRAHFSVSRSGAVAWRPGRAALTQVTAFDREGGELGTTGPPLPATLLSLSPDETRLLAAAVASSATLLDVGQPGSQDLGENWRYWSADGDRIIGRPATNAGAKTKMIARPVAGGETVELGEHDEVVDGVIMDLSPDRSQLLYARENGDLMVRRLGGSTEERMPKLVARGGGAGGAVDSGKFSPDGRWIVYSRGGLFVLPFPGPGLRRQIAPQGGWAQWRGDGQEILYFADGGIRSIPVEMVGGEPRFGTPRQLFSGVLRVPAGDLTVTFPLAVSRDGSRIYWLQSAEHPGSNLIDVRTKAVE